MLGVCQSYDATIDLVDNLSKYYDYDVLQLKKKIEKEHGVEVSRQHAIRHNVCMFIPDITLYFFYHDWFIQCPTDPLTLHWLSLIFRYPTCAVGK